MRELNEKGVRIKVYDSIDELPIKRFHKYNKFMLIDGGVGSDINDVNSHITKILAFISSDDKKNAIIELENMRELLYLVTEEISPKHLAFAALVAEINGVQAIDISDDGLKKVMQRLNNIKKGWFDNLIESLKKKIDTELMTYFKNTFEDATLKEYYDFLKKRVLLQIKQIIKGVDNRTEIEKINDSLLMFFKPKEFSGGAVEIEYDKNYEDMCLVLSEKLNANAKEMNVLEFYNAFEYLRKVVKENQRSDNSIRAKRKNRK